MDISSIGKEMYKWGVDLFPLCRSITGNGVRKTFDYLKEIIPDLETHEVPSGTKVLDWEVPLEWNVRDAYVTAPNGEKIIDFKESNLHLLNYSLPFTGQVSYEELNEHLYSLPDQPNAIPYVTSYYNPKWGFCIEHARREQLEKGIYGVKIDTELKSGFLTYGEVYIPGKKKKEILLSTYTCHPSMGNNELSGIVLATSLALWLSKQDDLEYSYRILFLPETIGPITYISSHLEQLKENVIAGYVITCVGDNNTFSFMPSRKGNTLSDRVGKIILKKHYPNFKEYSYLNRGSDERQYCAPGVNLPIASIMRSKYSEYKEYHTSLDDMNFISGEGLQGSFNVYTDCICLIEANGIIEAQIICEPQLGKRGLRSNLDGNKRLEVNSMLISNVLAYADGKMDCVDYLNLLDCSLDELLQTLELLKDQDLIKKSRL